MDTNGISWDSRQVFIYDPYLTELIDDGIENIALITPKGRYILTTDDILDYSEWIESDESRSWTRVIPFSRIR